MSIRVKHAPCESLMAATLNTELLKYRAGRLVLCPGCGSTMDWERTVEVSIYFDEKLVASMGGCTGCMSHVLDGTAPDEVEEVVHKAAKSLGVRVGDPRQLEAFEDAPRVVSASVEVIDGRVVAAALKSC